MQKLTIAIVASSLFAIASCSAEQDTESEKTPFDQKQNMAFTTEPIADIEVPKQWAGADIAMGKREFSKCRACHTTSKGGAQRIGPNLYGIFGSKAASNPEFRFSKALQDSNILWTAQTMDQWIADPKQMVKQTSMSFVGIRNPEKREALLAYLYQQTRSDTQETKTSATNPDQ